MTLQSKYQDMRMDDLSEEEKKKVAEAFSKSPVMVKKGKAAERAFNSAQFPEFIKRRDEAIKKRDEAELNKKSTNDSLSE